VVCRLTNALTERTITVALNGAPDGKTQFLPARQSS
jgi:hypothetical protein